MKNGLPQLSLNPLQQEMLFPAGMSLNIKQYFPYP